MIKVVKVVGLNSDALAAQVLTSDNEPQLFIVISTICDDAFSRSRQVLLEAEDIFYSLNNSIPDQVSKTVDVIKQGLGDVEQLHILLALLHTKEDDKKVLYLLRQGESLTAYMIRAGKRVNLLSDVADNELISGFLYEADRVILATNSLLELLGDDTTGLIEWSINSIGDEIEARLPQAEVDPVAAIIIEDEIETVDKIPEIQPMQVASNRIIKPYNQIFQLFIYSLVRVVKLLLRSKHGAVIVGLILFLVVLSGIVLSVKNQQQVKVQSEFSEHIKAAQDGFSQAQALKDLNPAVSAKSFNKAKVEIQLALKIRSDDKEAINLNKQINEAEQDILKVFQIGDISIWLDLELIKKDFKAKNLSTSVGKLLVLDQTQKSLVQIDLKSKAHQIISGEEKLGQAELISLNGDNAFVFSSDKGVVRVTISDKGVTQAIKPDNTWGQITDIYGFSNNIYLLDTLKSKIYKYIPISVGYSDKRDYLKENLKLDLTSATRMQIDGSVYVLKSTGEIIKFTQGNLDSFAVTGLDEHFQDPKGIFTSSDSEKVYVLDSGHSRLVVLDKKGVYLSQYKAEKLKDFVDFVIEEKDKSVYLLEGSKIYRFNLK